MSPFEPRAVQVEQQQQRTLERLRARVPRMCPLYVDRIEPDGRRLGGFRAVGPGCEQIGRAHIVTAFVDGYVAAWRAHSAFAREDTDD